MATHNKTIGQKLTTAARQRAVFNFSSKTIEQRIGRKLNFVRRQDIVRLSHRELVVEYDSFKRLGIIIFVEND